MFDDSFIEDTRYFFDLKNELKVKVEELEKNVFEANELLNSIQDIFGKLEEITKIGFFLLYNKGE